MSTVHELLNEQVGHEFSASQQYIAIAVWYDKQALPQLATHFYRQALEERNHAMMIVRYLIDREFEVVIPGVATVRTEFASVAEPLELALAQEKQVTAQFEDMITAARDQRNYLGEQFMHWFLKEQVEEVAAMSTLLQVSRRAGENVLLLEDYLARETVGDGGGDATAPTAAGGAV
jgi:bacterioferritin B